jgi:hypothetical protein
VIEIEREREENRRMNGYRLGIFNDNLGSVYISIVEV